MSDIILREEVAFNGNLLRLIYCPADLGAKYKIKYQKPDEYGFRYAIAWATHGEANRYFELLMKGGRK